MTSQNLRKTFKDFFTGLPGHPHLWLPSSSLIPDKDPSLLFVNAGMNQFKDCFLGLKPPPAPQVCSIQRCLRAGGKHNDLEQVGFSDFHHTFFEMMGNFSFGSYGKKQAIFYAMEFLTVKLNISRDHLWVSVFKEDKETARIWEEDQHFPPEKIFHLGEKDNFWRMGNTGPSGPCSEIYHYDGNKTSPTHEDMVEIWNLVFMEFNETKEGARVKLPKICIDTGVGLERLTTVLQKKDSNYHTDLFSPVMEVLKKETQTPHHNQTNNKTQKEKALSHSKTTFQVIADHSRAVVFLIHDGILPGSDGASYVLRRILRRALFYAHKFQNISSSGELLCHTTAEVIRLLSPHCPGLKKNQNLIQKTVKEEDSLFHHSLKTGKMILMEKIKTIKQKNPAPFNKASLSQPATCFTPQINDQMMWDLYSTYGFPPDLTRLIAKEEGVKTQNRSLKELKKRFTHPPVSHKKIQTAQVPLKTLIDDPEVVKAVQQYIQNKCSDKKTTFKPTGQAGKP